MGNQKFDEFWVKNLNVKVLLRVMPWAAFHFVPQTSNVLVTPPRYFGRIPMDQIRYVPGKLKTPTS